MNKIWLTQFVFDDPLDEDYEEKIEDLRALDDENIYVEYNDILCEVTLKSLVEDRKREELQKRVDKIYNTPVNVETVDLLNIELQYKAMEIFKDSLGYDHPLVGERINKIKKIISFDEIHWTNSLKLSSIFINHGDYSYAIRLLEPWVDDKDVPFVLLSTYVSVCTKVEYKVHSNRFYYALERIQKSDPDFFCELFKGDQFSVQTFVNTRVKKLWCDSCKK